VKRGDRNPITIEDLKDAVQFNPKVFPVKSNESNNNDDDDQTQKGDKEAESEARHKEKKQKK